MPLSARTPACTAMTAATLDARSGGRLALGLGVSGPQVVEGWYGVPFPKPLARMREYISILRSAWRRDVVTNDGPHYPLPYPGGTELGKPIKLTLHPAREQIPIYLGAEGPRNVALATEREAAVKAVPNDLADAISLVGPLARIRERLALWRASPVTQLLAAGVRDPEHLKAFAEMC
jgi:alkanesulfonate monooxygenase SsuD/methylene tetrahydromethanopterin reductase-like flavin-dependent oxidoreductase (luciferase family)